MFFNLILENKSGNRVDMTTTANQYMISKIEGLNPPPGTISTSSYAGMDGSYLNNAFIEKRNVVIHFEMRGIGIEKKRHQLYKVVKPSRYIKVYYSTANIDVFAEGYVETCEVNNFGIPINIRTDFHTLPGYLLVFHDFCHGLLQPNHRCIHISVPDAEQSRAFRAWQVQHA